MTSVFDRIQQFNQGRSPAGVGLKYQKMQEDAFAFFRGTCHLFYEDWPPQTPLNDAPLTWICGDLHLENFGTYKGNNRLTYFDINDFDEAVLVPCTWDLARLLTSIFVAAQQLALDETTAIALCETFLQAYRTALETGQIQTVESDTADGMIKDLLDSLKARNRQDFLDERTLLKKGRRSLLLDNKHPPIPTAERTALLTDLEQWQKQQPNPTFFKILDLTYRIAGNSSLGLRRYLLLVEGKGSPHQNYLLDLKAQPSSALLPFLSWQQPTWETPAQGVVAIQQRIQGTPPALLMPLSFNGQSYLLKELQPTQDRLNLSQAKGKQRRLAKVLETMGQIVAWGQLRSSGRQGSAIADEYITFAQNPKWQTPLLNYAQHYSRQVTSDHHSFCLALREFMEKPPHETQQAP